MSERIKLPEKPKTHRHIIFQPSAEGCLLLDQKNDRIHSLNRTAAFIWAFCDGKHSVSRIENAFKKHWKGPPANARSEVHQTIRKLKSLGLLQK